MADTKWIATRPIDHPIGSGIWAYGVGDDVPDVNVQAYGYDKGDDVGPYVAKVGTKAAAAAVVPDVPAETPA
jgi:hypothetical protein